MTKKRDLKTSASQAKSIKASCQLRDSKGHFIKGYKSVAITVDAGDTASTEFVTVANNEISTAVERENSWYQKLGEVAEKLTIVISSLDKLADFKDYISGNKNNK
jgi:hypothetical protein